jgi:hypothetical protein
MKIQKEKILLSNLSSKISFNFLFSVFSFSYQSSFTFRLLFRWCFPHPDTLFVCPCPVFLYFIFVDILGKSWGNCNKEAASCPSTQEVPPNHMVFMTSRPVHREISTEGLSVVFKLTPWDSVCMEGLCP